MAKITYTLGSAEALEQLYPPAKFANKDLKFKNYEDVIAHYTRQSLAADGFRRCRVRVRRRDGRYDLSISADASERRLKSFAGRHQQLFGPDAAQKAITGMQLMKELGVWNPMAGYHVNESPSDGRCKWHIFPPLGLNVLSQKGMLLMHYPPWQTLQQATFLHVMTMNRWNTILGAVGVPDDELSYYRTILDVNPIAAPGSGQSEYPNDYFPIMMASAFFDGPRDRAYIKSMMELYLNPPGRRSRKYTVPLLVCGSPLYDPQAPGWFRVAYKDQLPTKDNKKRGIVEVNVLQAGEFRVHPESKKLTPYMVANHMIAAGVTGKCTRDARKIPDIRRYEAEDLVAATFLRLYDRHPDITPTEAKQEACLRWFGNKCGVGAPNPPAEADRRVICALAQMDLFFCPTPMPHPKYSYAKALRRCRDAHNADNPCAPPIGPSDESGDCGCTQDD